MKITRKLALLIITVGILSILSVAMVAPVAAQPTGACVDIGRLTSGAILVDVPTEQQLGGIPTNAVQCRVLARNGEFARDTAAGGSVGTPREGQTLNRASDNALDYGQTLASIDVWIAGDVAGDFFGWFGTRDTINPVRVCFRATDADIELARNPGEGEIGAEGRFLIFNDARYFNANAAASRSSNFPNSDPAEFAAVRSRTTQQLNVVPEGLELGYICGDLSVPGQVSVVNRLPVRPEGSPVHPNAELPSPDRCPFPGARSCRN
ncbi:MAG: hypothetical protein SF029_00450 [bacterium]|nr:hypothetical protein [bacterium]